MSPILMYFTPRPNNSSISTKQTAAMLGAMCVWLASSGIRCCWLKFEDGQSSSFMYLIRMHFYFFNIYIFVFLVKLTSSLLVIKLNHAPINNNDSCKDLGKQLQYFYATNRNISRPNLLRAFGQLVATCRHNGCCRGPYSRENPLSYLLGPSTRHWRHLQTQLISNKAFQTHSFNRRSLKMLTENILKTGLLEKDDIPMNT